MCVNIIAMTEDQEAQEAQKYYNETRHDEKEYNKRKDHILQNGILCKLQFQADYTHTSWDPFYSLKVTFPPNFKHLLKKEAVKTKEASSSGFHISLGNRSSFNDNAGMLAELNGIWWKYHEPKAELLKHLYIANSGTIIIDKPDPVYFDLVNVVKHGTGKANIHISLD